MDGIFLSAIADFLNIVNDVPTVTLVGDTSAGASGAPKVFSLPSGRRVRISTLNIQGYPFDKPMKPRISLIAFFMQKFTSPNFNSCNSWRISYTVCQVYNFLNISRYDGTPVELNGIIPDVLVMQTEADIKAGHDPQLERALAILT